MTLRLEKAREEDQAGIFQLLAEHHLPLEGLREHLETTIVARVGEKVVGSAALEVYSDGALMRSVAVSPALQNQGLGRQLIDAVIDLARDAGSPDVYLLTTTADGYFPKLGFERITRDDVPKSVQMSVEFQSACPSSATVMRRSLRGTSV